MRSSSPPYADKLNEFFYEGLGRQTSVCLYGSAATGNWVPGRSDLDLIILVPEEKLELLGQKIREWAWASTPKYPILDGYALSVSRSGRLVKRLDEFVKVTYPSDAIDGSRSSAWRCSGRAASCAPLNGNVRFRPEPPVAFLHTGHSRIG